MKLLSLALAVSLLAGCALLAPSAPDTPPQAAKPAPSCAGQPLPKVLVTAFPLRYPEQIRLGEYIGWGETTAEELAGALARAGQVRAAAAARRIAFAHIEGEPELERDAAGKPRLLDWAAKARAQYVLAGVFADFGRNEKWLVVPERQFALEAYLYDGITGALIARRAFTRQAPFVGSLPASVAPGTREFAATRLGAAYHDLVAEMAAWVQEALACRPLPARVTQIEGRRLTLDVGADGGLRSGTGLSLSPPGNGSAPRPDAIVREVRADHAVAELALHRDPRKVGPGEAFYVVDAPIRNRL